MEMIKIWIVLGVLALFVTPVLLGLIVIGGLSLLFIGFSEAIKGGFGK